MMGQVVPGILIQPAGIEGNPSVNMGMGIGGRDGNNQNFWDILVDGQWSLPVSALWFSVLSSLLLP